MAARTARKVGICLRLLSSNTAPSAPQETSSQSPLPSSGTGSKSTIFRPHPLQTPGTGRTTARSLRWSPYPSPRLSCSFLLWRQQGSFVEIWCLLWCSSAHLSSLSLSNPFVPSLSPPHYPFSALSPSLPYFALPSPCRALPSLSLPCSCTLRWPPIS